MHTTTYILLYTYIIHIHNTRCLWERGRFLIGPVLGQVLELSFNCDQLSEAFSLTKNYWIRNIIALFFAISMLAKCLGSSRNILYGRSTDSLFFSLSPLYRILGKLSGGKVWKIDSFWAFGQRKFGKLIDQPIGY